MKMWFLLLGTVALATATPFYYNDYAPRYPGVLDYSQPKMPYYNPDRIDLGDILREVLGDDGIKIATFGAPPRDSRYDSNGNKRYNSDRFGDLVRELVGEDLYKIATFGVTPRDSRYDANGNHIYNSNRMFPFGKSFYDLVRRGGMSPGSATFLPKLYPDLFNANRIGFNYPGHVPGPLTTVRDPLKDPFYGHINRDRTIFPNFFPHFPFQTPPLFHA